MTSLFAARRRAGEFAAALDGGAEDGALDLEVARLVGVVAALRSHHRAEPRADFTGELRLRLMAEAENVLIAGNATLALPVRARGPRERRLVSAASAVILLGGTAGMAAASHSALPGEALYPIKRGIERADAQLNLSQTGKGLDLLDQATHRLTEVGGLLSQDSHRGTPRIPQTLDSFSLQATEGAGLLFDSFDETRDPSLILQIRTFASDGISVLEQFAPDVAPDAQDELADAALTLRTIDQQATAVCATCSADMPDVQIPGLILARREVDRARNLLPPAGLDNSHPVVVPRGTVRSERARQPADTATGKAPSADPTIDASDVPSTDGLKPDDTPTLSVPGTDVPVSGDEDPAAGAGGVVETLLPDPDVPLP